MPEPPILAITDRRQCAEPLEMRAQALCLGGCRYLSVREKDLPARERLALLKRLVAIAETFGATLGVHDDLAAAAALGTALHLPAGGDAAAARRTLGSSALIGKSCHSGHDLESAADDGVDYATLGPIFPSISKPGYAPPRDIAAIVAQSRIPVLALGGVTAQNLPVVPTGFAGIAVMGEAMRTPDAASWFERIRTAWPASRTV